MKNGIKVLFPYFCALHVQCILVSFTVYTTDDIFPCLEIFPPISDFIDSFT